MTTPTTTSASTTPTSISTNTTPTTYSTATIPTTTRTTTSVKTTPNTTSTTTSTITTPTTTSTTTSTTTTPITTPTTTTPTKTSTTTSPSTASIPTTTPITMSTTSSTTAIPTTLSTTTSTPTSPIYTTETTRSTEDNEWIKVKFCEYYINLDNLTFLESVRYCKEELNSTLLFFNHCALYIRYMKENKLNISSGTFWVAGNSVPNDTDCFNMDVENYDAVLHGLDIDCGVKRGSICARAIRYNSTEHLYNEVMNDPDFIKMIEEMTVKKNATQKSLRKKISTRDHTAVQAGTGVSLAMMVGSFAFVMMCDIPRIKNALQKREKKVKKGKDKRRARKQSEA